MLYSEKIKNSKRHAESKHLDLTFIDRITPPKAFCWNNVKKLEKKCVNRTIMPPPSALMGPYKQCPLWSYGTGNGGEFSSDEMREITSILNIQLCTTAGERPFQNGLCERVHAITDMMLVRLILRHNCLGHTWLEIPCTCGMVTVVTSSSLEKIPTCKT